MAPLNLLEVLHYWTPLFLAICFVCVGSLVLCGPYAASNSKLRHPRYRRALVSLMLAVDLTYAVEILYYIVQAFVEPRWLGPKDAVASSMISIALWGTLTMLLAEDSLTLHPYLSSWAVAGLFEVLICSLMGSSDRWTENDQSHVLALTILSGLRFLLFCSLCGLGAWSPRKGKGLDEECQREPLLSNGEANTSDAYGAVPQSAPQDPTKGSSGEEDDEEDSNKAIKERQAKRLKDSGGWWGYLKDFAVFGPYIWPSKSPRMKTYLALLGMLSLVERALGILVPRQLGIITDALGSSQGSGRMPWKEVSIWVVLKWLDSGAGISPFQNFLGDRVEMYVDRQIYDLAFSHVMGLSMDFHNDKNTGEVMKAVEQAGSLSSTLETVFFQIAPVFFDMVIAVWYMTYLFDIFLAIIVLMVGVLYVWTTYKMTSLQAPRRRTWQSRQRKQYDIMNGAVTNWQTVSYFNRKEYEETRFSGALSARILSTRSYYDICYITWSLDALIMTLGLGCAVYLAAYRISQGTATVGSFVTLITVWGSISSPLHTIARSFKWILSDLIDAERLLEVIQTKPTISDKEDAVPLMVSSGDVEFAKVSFSYDPRKKTLDDMSFTVKGGTTVALVGETGGGKSTTLKLLLRFYDVSDGSVKIDGQDVRDITLESLRAAFGVVPQDPALFNQSILENVRYGRLDATDEEVEEACKAASIHDKILTFPDGYRSKVGERGVKLSGGELQRVAIARVVLKKPSLVLLDEATSSVDSATEQTIQDSFRELSKGRTTFVVAHRLSTIMNADMILVIEGGNIVERGTHEELLGRGGKYDKLWTRQSAKPTTTTGKAPTQEGDSGSAKGTDSGLLIDIPDDVYASELARQKAAQASESFLDQAGGAAANTTQETEASSSERHEQPGTERSLSAQSAAATADGGAGAARDGDAEIDKATAAKSPSPDGNGTSTGDQT